uniref:Uncharacterized protein n=1 Tax=Panagrolaimus sp. JU765 TaxID=591449 RepID=A0AC34R8H3_9BILA
MFTGANSLNFEENRYYPRRRPFQKIRKHEKIQRIGGFALESRKKRYATKSNDGFELLPSQMQLTPIGWVAKNVLGKVLELKNKTQTQYTPWQKAVGMARETSVRRKEIRRRAKARDEEYGESLAFRGMDNHLDPEDLMDMLDEKVDKRKLLKNLNKGNKDPTTKMLKFLREGMKLINVVFGKNISNFNERNMNVMSPRFFSVVPEDKGDD